MTGDALANAWPVARLVRAAAAVLADHKVPVRAVLHRTTHDPEDGVDLVRVCLTVDRPFEEAMDLCCTTTQTLIEAGAVFPSYTSVVIREHRVEDTGEAPWNP